MTESGERDAYGEWIVNGGSEEIAIAKRREWFFYGIFVTSFIFYLILFFEAGGIVSLFQLALATTLLGLILGAYFANKSYRLEEERKRLIRVQGKALWVR